MSALTITYDNLSGTLYSSTTALGLGAAIAFSLISANDAKAENITPTAIPTAPNMQEIAVNEAVDASYAHSNNCEELGIIVLVGNNDREAGWTPVGMGEALESILNDNNTKSKAFGAYIDQPESAITYTFVARLFESIGPHNLEAAAGYSDEAARRFLQQTQHIADNAIVMVSELDANMNKCQ